MEAASFLSKQIKLYVKQAKEVEIYFLNVLMSVLHNKCQHIKVSKNLVNEPLQ